MKRLFIAFLFISCACSAQEKMNVYFLKNNGRYVTVKDSADYMRIVTEPDSGSTLYNIAEYYLDGKKKSIGKSSKIDPPSYEGQRIRFYKSGGKEMISFYKDGTSVDDEFGFYPNGKPYLVVKYPAVPSPNRGFDDYLIMANYDSTGVAGVVNGNGSFKIYDDHFKQIVEAGMVKDGKRDGECTGSEFNGTWKYTEKYDNGVLISGTMTDDKGVVSTYTQTRSTAPQYKGGLSAFYKYLGNKIVYPEYESDHKIQGVVVMSFVVEKNGKISDIKILNPVSPAIDKEATRVVKNSPLWIAGTRFGRPVRVSYVLPLNFSLN